MTINVVGQKDFLSKIKAEKIDIMAATINEPVNGIMIINYLDKVYSVLCDETELYKIYQYVCLIKQGVVI